MPNTNLLVFGESLRIKMLKNVSQSIQTKTYRGKLHVRAAIKLWGYEDSMEWVVRSGCTSNKPRFVIACQELVGGAPVHESTPSCSN